MLLQAIIIILFMKQNLQLYASGFDAYTSCYRTSRKRPDVPCDFDKQNWCNLPGNGYPWHAVRRFVHENQGLMRRMYGDERHISVLRAELDNEVEDHNEAHIQEQFRHRYSKDMDGTRDFVKILGRRENARKLTPAEKTKKAIDEKSNNNLFHSYGKNEDVYKSANSFVLNKTTLKPTTTTTTITTTTTSTTTKPPNTTNTTERQKPTTLETTPIDVPSTVVDVTTETIASQLEVSDPSFNFTNSTVLIEEEPFVDEAEYVSETEETLTTTVSDALTTTEEVDFEDDEELEEVYEDGIEEGDMEEQETSEEPVTQKAPPILRLKGINACPVKEEVVAPFWANNTRGEVLALLNLYPFEQYVHWEKCTYEHKQMFCREGCKCEQQYRLHRLLAYDPNNECRGIFSDWFRFPSCCVCKCYDLPMEFRLTSRSPRFKIPRTVGRPTS